MGCFVFVSTKSHQKFHRNIHLPHSAACAACAGAPAPCSAHTAQQTVVFSFSPSATVDSVERMEIRKKERLMLEADARCAACGGTVQNTDPSGRHYLKS